MKAYDSPDVAHMRQIQSLFLHTIEVTKTALASLKRKRSEQRLENKKLLFIMTQNKFSDHTPKSSLYSYKDYSH